MNQQITKILLYGDDPHLPTGNAKLVRGVLNELTQRQEDYDLTLFSLIVNGDEYELIQSLSELCPYRIIPSYPNVYNDRFGINRLKILMQNESFDIILTIGDIWRFDGFRSFLNSLPLVPSWVCWFPIDHKLRHSWMKLIKEIDYPLVYSQYGRDQLKDAGIERGRYFKPPIYPDIFRPLPAEEKALHKDKYIMNDWPTLGFIGRNQIRKDPMSMLRAFNRIHETNPQINLFMITQFHAGHYNMHTYIGEHNLKISSVHPENKWSDQNINEIINCFDVFVSTSIAEGLNYPLIETQLAEIPIVVPMNSAMTELVNNGQGIGVTMDQNNIEYLPITEYGATIHIELPRVNIDGLVNAIQWAVHPENKEKMRAIGQKGRDFALDYFSKKPDWNGFIQEIATEQKTKKEKQAQKEERKKERYWLVHKAFEPITNKILTTIPTWGKNCGIAEYTHALLQANMELSSQNGQPEYQFDLYPHKMRDIQTDQGNIKTFMEYVERESPSLIHFQHEWGLYPHHQEMPTFIKTLKEAGLKTVLTLHTLSMSRALNVSLTDLDTVIVHSEKAKTSLINDGINNVSVIPMGIHDYHFEPEEIAEMKRTLEIEKYHPIIGSCGFIREQKGYFELLATVGQIKSLYPDALLLIHAPMSFSGWGIDEAFFMAIEEEALDKNVAVIRSFLSTREQILLLSCCDILALPYRSTPNTVGYGSSAAARACIAARKPLITSENEYFEDLEGEVFKVKNPIPQNIRMAIELMQRSRFAREKMLRKQQQYIDKNNWIETSKKHRMLYQQILEGAGANA